MINILTQGTTIKLGMLRLYSFTLVILGEVLQGNSIKINAYIVKQMALNNQWLHKCH